MLLLRPSALLRRERQQLSVAGGRHARPPAHTSSTLSRAPPAAQWYVIDAEGQTLGRVASLAAYYIRGKHLPTYTPSMDMGAYGEGPAPPALPRCPHASLPRLPAGSLSA